MPGIHMNEDLFRVFCIPDFVDILLTKFWNLEAPTIRDNDGLAASLACELSSDVLHLVSDVDVKSRSGNIRVTDTSPTDHVCQIAYECRKSGTFLQDFSAETRAQVIEKFAPTLANNKDEITLANVRDVRMATNTVTDPKRDHLAARNAMETLLIHGAHIENQFLKRLCDHLKIYGVTLFAGPGLIRYGGHLSENMKSASNLSLEYGNLQCTVNVVESMDEAVQHIALYGSAYIETIMTENGAEVGINKGRIHSRDPLRVDGLVPIKWILRGEGQCVSDFGKQNFKHEKLPVSFAKSVSHMPSVGHKQQRPSDH
ncbi:hypothetical protein PHET_00560 [Paragonimus heterotremus]|uniref:Uncharacterized protein n=1 Tax=Paragonimus heterotremus TaxID=100268 RepID=A0A8J4SV03_9TREM|nr:hypothetical protein PHET_00560 [Paragonimus heterotremus]